MWPAQIGASDNGVAIPQDLEMAQARQVFENGIGDMPLIARFRGHVDQVCSQCLDVSSDVQVNRL